MIKMSGPQKSEILDPLDFLHLKKIKRKLRQKLGGSQKFTKKYRGGDLIFCRLLAIWGHPLRYSTQL